LVWKVQPLAKASGIMSDDTFRPFDLDPSIYEVDEIAGTALQC